MYQRISEDFAEMMENKQQVITTAKLGLKCLTFFCGGSCHSFHRRAQPASSRVESETDLQECKDKEVTMIEEVDVGRVGCCRVDSWHLWKTWIIYALQSGPQLQPQSCFCNSHMQKYCFGSADYKGSGEMSICARSHVGLCADSTIISINREAACSQLIPQS